MKAEQPKTVLVVEDDPDIRSVVAEILELAGYRVLTAQDGKEALGRLSQLSHPCLVLLDLRMPRMDGRALLRVMRQVEEFQQLPVVVMTADSGSVPRETKEVLTKPFEVERLLTTVGTHCH